MKPEPEMITAHEKFSRAVHALAAGEGDIQQRVASAAYHITTPFVRDDLPDDLQQEFRELEEELTRVPDAEIGSVRATARALSDEDAKALASTIVSMNEEVCRRLGARLALRQAQHSR